MIAEIEVSHETTVKDLRKAARRAAMTGGYELTLHSELSARDLEQIVETFLPELEQRVDKGVSEYRSCNAFRILALVVEHPELKSSLREQLGRFLLSPGVDSRSS